MSLVEDFNNMVDLVKEEDAQLDVAVKASVTTCRELERFLARNLKIELPCSRQLDGKAVIDVHLDNYPQIYAEPKTGQLFSRASSAHSLVPTQDSDIKFDTAGKFEYAIQKAIKSIVYKSYEDLGIYKRSAQFSNELLEAIRNSGK